MRLSPLLLALASISPSLSLDPNDCSTKEKERTGADFVLTEQPDNTHLKALSAKLTRVSVSAVLDDGNHRLVTDAAGKKRWEKTDDFNDFDTEKWVPQGITSTADALDVGTYEGRDAWVVSWHRADDKSARVSFVDRADDTYRHALLVYPFADDDFREVPVHAGGIMWYGNTLWVADTKNGIRVFDMDNIWRVETGDGVGKKSGGGYSAANYKYVVPQIRWYKWSSNFNYNFSYLSLDRTTTPDSILIGEYQKVDGIPMRLMKFDLDYTTRRLRTAAGGVAKATWAYCVDILRMQGAVAANGRIYISRSNGASEGDMWGWIPGKLAHNNAHFFPPSPEDLSYDKRGNKIYGLTEVAGGRYIITAEARAVFFE